MQQNVLIKRIIYVFLFFILGCGRVEFQLKGLGSTVQSKSLNAHVGEGLKLVFQFENSVITTEGFSQPLSNLVQISEKNSVKGVTAKFINSNHGIQVNLSEFTQSGNVNVSLDTSKLVYKKTRIQPEKLMVTVDVLSNYFNICGNYLQDSEILYEKSPFFICDKGSGTSLQIWKFNKNLNALELWKDLNIDLPYQSGKLSAVDIYYVSVEGGVILFSTERETTDVGYSKRQSWIFDFSQSKLIHLPIKLSPKKSLNGYGGMEGKNFFMKDGLGVYISAAETDTEDYELYKYDLKNETYSLIADINSTQSSAPREAARDTNREVYFSALCEECSSLRELFKLDLDTDSVTQLTNINGRGSHPMLIIPLENEVLYVGIHHTNNITYSGSIFSFDKETQNVNFITAANPHGGYPLKPYKFFKAGSFYFFEGFVGTANPSDEDPVHAMLLRLDLESKTTSPIIEREVLLGPSGTGCWIFYSCVEKTRAADIRISGDVMEWKQWTAESGKTLLYSYNLNTQKLSSKDFGMDVGNFYALVNSYGAISRELSGDSFDLDFKGYYKMHSEYGLGYFVD